MVTILLLCVTAWTVILAAIVGSVYVIGRRHDRRAERTRLEIMRDLLPAPPPNQPPPEDPRR